MSNKEKLKMGMQSAVEKNEVNDLKLEKPRCWFSFYQPKSKYMFERDRKFKRNIFSNSFMKFFEM